MPAHAAPVEGGGVRLVLQFVVVSAAAGVLLAGLVLPLAGTAGYVARSSSEHFERLPSELATPPLPERSRVLAADGSVIATFFSENRIVVPLDRMAPELHDAVIAIEDSRFYKHNGLDVKGTTRALLRNTAAGGVQQGGSTLTQQYVKNVLLEKARNERERQAALEQSISRKLQELRYAVALEKKLTKEQILERYLNIAYFGSGAYGAEAAARHYFSKSAGSLELHEAALLAGVIRAPGAYDPTDFPDAARERRDIVLDRMAELDMVSGTEAQEAKAKGLGLKVSEVGNGCPSSRVAPLFCDYVYNVIENAPEFGKTPQERLELLYRGGLTIRTTLQPHVQRAAQRSLDRWTNRKDRVGAAIAMVQPGTGRVRAMAQNHPFGGGGTFINYAVDKRYGGSNGFQGGSTFKPFVLATALDQGLPLSLRLSGPTEITVDGFKDCESGGSMKPYDVGNWESSGYRSLDMREATWRSVNTYFVQLEQRTGICEPVNLAKRMGLRQADGDRLGYNPSFVLGSDEVSPLGMAEAYATFAARGKHCNSVAITRVTDRDGDRLPVPQPRCKKVLDKDVADAVNYVLEGVISGPDSARTGAAMDIGRPAGGKTGTSNDTVAVWFNGYTPQLAAAVWVGHPKGSIPLENVTIGGNYYSSLCGGCLPGPIWRDAMLAALEGRPVRSFVEPLPEFRFGDTVTVPDVSGLSYDQARAVLEDSGLGYELSNKRVPSSVPAGLVADTRPGEGATVEVGTVVTIYLSDGAGPRPGRGGGEPDGRPQPPDGGGTEPGTGPGNGNPGRGDPDGF